MSQTLSPLIPVTHIAAVEAALQQAFGTTVATDISSLAGGLSASSVYKIVINGQAYVLKIDVTTATSLSENLVCATAAGIAPPVYYHDAANGISISGFIDNKPIRAVFSPDKLTSELAATIRAIHAIPCAKDGNDLLATIEAMVGKFQQTNMLSGPVFDECFQHFKEIKSKYPWQDTDRVFSHNDLNPNNILCDGERIWIVDWDVAFLNDRYVDLANAANFFVHTEELEKAFLAAYFGHEANGYQTARFYVMRQVCRIIYAMLMFQLASQGKPADYVHNQDMEGISMKEFGALMGAGKISLANYEGQLMYGKALLNEALHQMRTLRFTRSLAQLDTVYYHRI